MRAPILSLMLTLTLISARAAAQPAAPAPDQPIWPPDCTRDMPRDGLVLLDTSAFAEAASVEVTLRRSSDGAPVAGAFEAPAAPAGSPVRWRSHAALSPGTEYKIEARASDARATSLVGYFTTGDSFLAPLAFSGRPAVRVMARAAQSAPDGEVVLLRIAVPALSGGLPQRTLQVSATLADVDTAELAAALRSGHAQSAQPGQALGFEVEALLRDAPSQRCVQITARDDLGHELALDPELCVSLPARAGAPGETDGAAQAHAFEAQAAQEAEADDAARTFETQASQQAAAATTADPEAQGCAMTGARTSGGWLSIALLALCATRRRTINLPG
jgi:hypothetical protein